MEPVQTRVAVAVSAPLKFTVVGITLQLRPVGEMVTLRLTALLKPPVLVSVMVLVPLLLVLKLSVVGLAEMEKSPPALAPTMRVATNMKRAMTGSLAFPLCNPIVFTLDLAVDPEQAAQEGLKRIV